MMFPIEQSSSIKPMLIVATVQRELNKFEKKWIYMHVRLVRTAAHINCCNACIIFCAMSYVNQLTKGSKGSLM